MTLEIKPCTPCGKVFAPPSKSVAHRYLICEYLCGEKCSFENIVFSNDVLATKNCIEALKNGGELICGESASTLRFLIPLALLKNRKIVFKGSERLFERPLDYYKKLCRENNFLFERKEGTLTVKGKLEAGNYEIPGNVSSQFITGMIFALSALKENSKIKVKEPFESKSYVLITVDVLKQFGVIVEIKDNEIFITGNQKYQRKDLRIEGDYTNGAYLEAFRFSGGRVEVEGLNKSRQGDRVYKELFEKLKENVTIDISDCPDLGPVLFAVSALNKGGKFTGTRRLAMKESNRVLAMKEELEKFGVEVVAGENEVEIKNPVLYAPKEELSSHNDHRIFMALMILLCKTGGKISGAEAVNKSFPDYFEKIKELGLLVKDCV